MVGRSSFSAGRKLTAGIAEVYGIPVASATRFGALQEPTSPGSSGPTKRKRDQSRCAAPVPRARRMRRAGKSLRACADLDRLHRGLGFGAGLVDGAVGADYRPLGGDLRLVDDLSWLRLCVLDP